MRNVARSLLLVSRFLAICALIAGLGAGLLTATLGSAFVCVDSCPTPEVYFPLQGPTALHVMAPCVALELLALVTFVTYCAIVGQRRRAVRQVVALFVGGIVGAAALNAFLTQGQMTPPLTFDGYFEAATLEAWVNHWGLVLTLVVGAWSGGLAYLQWRAG